VTAAAAVALCAPLLDGQWFQSHERDAYVVRTVEWAASLERGQLYPRWCPDLYGGYGSPFFVFYAPLVYAVAGALAAFVTGPIVALKVVIAGASVLAGLGVYLLVHGETRRADAALVGALAYLAAPYRVCDLYVRGDLAEYTALALLPLALALYRAAALSLSPRRAAACAVGAGVCHALVVLSHTLLGLWGTGFIALVLLATAPALLRRRAGRRLLLLLGAFAAALAMSAVYTLPAFAYRGLVRVDQMTAGEYEPSDNWIRASALVEPGMYQVVPLLALAALLASVALVRDWRAARAPWAWLALAGGFIALTLPVASGLWGQRELAVIRYIQFPWRLLGLASLAAAVSAGMAFGRAVPSGRWWSGVGPALAAALVVLLGWPLARPSPLAAHTIIRDPESIRSRMLSTTGVDEYLPRSVPAPPAVPQAALVREAQRVQVRDHSAAGEHVLEAEAAAAGAVIALALHDFPGWRLETQAGPAPAALAARAGLLEARLPVAGSYRLRLAFAATPLVRVAQAISLLALLLLPALRRLARPSPVQP
jgi:hypothetical protein